MCNKRQVAREMVTNIETGKILSSLPVFNSDMNSILRSWHVLIYSVASLDRPYPPDGLLLYPIIQEVISDLKTTTNSRRSKADANHLERLLPFLQKYDPLIFRHGGRTWIRFTHPVFTTYDLGTSFLLPMRIYMAEFDWYKEHRLGVMNRALSAHFIYNLKFIN